MYIDLVLTKQRINILEEKLTNIFSNDKISNAKNELSELEKISTSENFWTDKSMEKTMLNIKRLNKYIEEYTTLNEEIESLKINVSLLSEESDEELEKDTSKKLDILEKKLEYVYINTLLSGEYDTLSAIVTIHAGAGGTESQDYVCMLYRMYQKWCDKENKTLTVYDIIDGEEAGYKSITFKVEGEFSYGYLKCEKGVHRLVRISPFDSNKRRHTSFAAVDVMPELDDSVEIDIKPEEIEMQTFRASGAGGQHINKTDSAVRIKHIPTGIVVSCQAERSQIQNRETCMKMLKSKLYIYEQEKNMQKLKEIKGENSENGWGSQIRSYVMCPYTMVKDHRTGYEVGNVDAVFDGEITPFITEYLKLLSKEQ